MQRLTPEQLTALFAAIPADWAMPDLRAVIAADTLSEPLAQQLAAWIDARPPCERHLIPLGRTCALRVF